MNQPLAYIHPEAKIAQNVVVEPFSTIYKNVEIGEGTWVGPNVTIMEGARIGKNCKLYPGCVISAAPQDLKYKGEPSTVYIGDNSVIRECVTINRGTAMDKNTTNIGANCLVMAYVHIAHDCIIGDNVILVNSVQLAGHIEVQDFAIIGGTTAVLQFVKIGAHAMIGGGSLVRKDVPPFVKAAREPLTYAGINSIGLRRRGFSNEKINEIQEIYRTLFLGGLNHSKALDKIELEMLPSDERDEIINFFPDIRTGRYPGVIRKKMQIKLSGLGKRYNYDWIFRHLSYEFVADKAYAILGYNGSGKSTFINTLSGNLTPSEGAIQYQNKSRIIAAEAIYRYLSFSAPYLELVEEFTLIELLQFHTHFKPLRNLSPQQLMERMYLEKARHKYVKDFSSGMKQRLKLGLAIYTEAPLLLLDEPTTNLDQAGINWYLEHVSHNRKGRLVVVCSNIAHEYSFCDQTLDITQFHPIK